MAKFKGNKEDWLDDENASTSRSVIRKPKKGKPLVSYLSRDLANGRVVEVFPNQCLVMKLDTQERIACTYRKAKLPTLELRERSPVAVGDLVKFDEISKTDGVIDGVCERENSLSRPAPERAQKHVLVANVKKLVIVSAVKNPDFSPGLIDRFVIAAEHEGIDVCIVVNKSDLLSLEDRQKSHPWSLYEDLSYPVKLVCAKTGEGMESLRNFMGNDLTTFCGHSGVGKTSLLNTLIGREIGRTKEVSDSTNKGLHTTTGAILIQGTNLIDTPGVREFGITGIKPEEIRDYFREFKQLKCKDDQCFHLNEEGCVVKHLPRYGSYKRIVMSLLEDT